MAERNDHIFEHIFERIYNFFSEKYKDSLFAPVSGDIPKNPEDRMQYYMQLLFGSNTEENKAKIKQIMNCIFTYKKNPQLILTTSSFIHYHGTVAKKFQTVPDNCVICYLTPLSYYCYINKIDVAKNNTIIFNSNFIEEFSANPFCMADYYRKQNVDRETNLFEHYKLYFPGQKYVDTLLQGDSSDKQMGIYSKSSDLSINYQEVLHSEDDEILLSSLIIKYKLKGLIIVYCCRGLDTYSVEHKNSSIPDNTTDISHKRATQLIIGEHMINIINKSVWYFTNPEQYNECMYKYGENYNIRNNLYTKRTLESPSKFLLNRISQRKYSNRSFLGQQIIPFITGLSTEILSILNSNIYEKIHLCITDGALVNIFESLDKILKSDSYDSKLFKILCKNLSNIKNVKLFSDILNSVINLLQRHEDHFISFCDLFGSFLLYMIIKQNDVFYKKIISPEVLRELILHIKNILLSFCKLDDSNIKNLLAIISSNSQLLNNKIYLNNNKIDYYDFRELSHSYIVLNNNPGYSTYKRLLQFRKFVKKDIIEGILEEKEEEKEKANAKAKAQNRTRTLSKKLSNSARTSSLSATTKRNNINTKKVINKNK